MFSVMLIWIVCSNYFGDGKLDILSSSTAIIFAFMLTGDANWSVGLESCKPGWRCSNMRKGWARCQKLCRRWIHWNFLRMSLESVQQPFVQSSFLHCTLYRMLTRCIRVRHLVKFIPFSLLIFRLVRKRDIGFYECQISTANKMSFRVYLNVIGNLYFYYYFNLSYFV